jgi:hypothetical protein
MCTALTNVRADPKSSWFSLWTIIFSTKKGAPLKPVREGRENPENEQFCLSEASLIASGFFLSE